MKQRKLIIATLLAQLLVSCGDDLVNNKYCSYPARFTFNPVNSIQQLYSSCESLGEWCTITTDGNKFYFTKPNGSQGQANRTAITGYTGFYMGFCGFIVGLPNIPELGYEQSVITCYDLACPNCYETQSVTRKLTLTEGGYAICQSGSNPCHRKYDLNNQGIVCDKLTSDTINQNRNLFRYRVYYGNNTLSISN